MNSDDIKKRILVVDDDTSVCRLLTDRLNREGFDSRSCSSGREALELLERESFDAVISDLRMSGVSGLALLEEARRKYPRLTFLMATAENDIRVGIAAMRQGAADYLTKPLELNAVVASLNRALDVKRLELELQNYRERLEEMVNQRTKQLQVAMKRIEQTYDDTLEALGAALDLRDNETAGHSRRVTQYCLEMARAMGCSGEKLKHIERGAYLHDIGKIGIPDGILLKPAKLTPDEREVMETHARIGYELVSRVAFLAPAAEIVLTHQERFDGTGYPQGLVGEEIPLGARIFAVSDTLDAMTTDRPYRKALPFSVAHEEILNEAGKQFDPDVVRIFQSIPDPVWDDIRLETKKRKDRSRLAGEEPRRDPAKSKGKVA